MDTRKVGTFLKQLRKENHMTQEQLGERIGVTNKTISRWETGNYMPPVECLELLSGIYQISINEILAGERVGSENFAEIADENLVLALEEIQKENQKFEKRMLGVLIFTTVLAIAILVLLPLRTVKDTIIFVMVLAMAFVANTLNIVAIAARKERKAGEKV